MTLPLKEVMDGWMDGTKNLGNFFNDTGEDGDVEAQVMKIKHRNGKGGLIVQGMEFRPE